MVDNFGVNVLRDNNLQHLIDALQIYYEIEIDIERKRYCGITLDQDYNSRTLDTSMKTFVPKKLKEFKHPKLSKPQHAPYPALLNFSNSQKSLKSNCTPQLNEKQTKRVKHIIGSFLFYAQAINLILLKALGTLRKQQSKPKETTNKNTTRLLDYLPTYSDVKMILQHIWFILQFL